MQQNETEAAINTHGLDIEKIRADFPMLSQHFNGKQLIYLDSAASSQKPQAVIDRLVKFYTTEYGKPKEAHTISKSVTQMMEESREKVAKLMNAANPEEIVFTKGCTEGINIVANGFSRAILKPGDEIVISQLEHHANIVPWQVAYQLTGAKLKVAPLTPADELDIQALENMITDKTRIVSVSHSSHVLGTIQPIQKIAALAHKKGVPLLADGAQTAPHMPIDMQELDCDFYTFSGHKMGSPTGVGVLYGKEEWLNKIAPLNGGGEMSKEVEFEKSKYASIPTKFEGGTSPFADIIAFGTTVDYVSALGMEKIEKYELELLYYMTEKLSEIDRVKIYGKAPEKEPVLSFTVEGMDVKKLEKYLNDEWSIAVKAGDLTAQPLLKVLGVESLIRASLCYYNTVSEVDTFIEAVQTFISKKG